jgi:hypothetical protein
MCEVQASDVERAIGAAREAASAVGLTAAEARVVQNSNKVALRVLPCDVFARVAVAGSAGFEAELELARQLADVDAPVARLEPRVEPRVHERDGFAVTFWTYYEQTGEAVAPADFAQALERLHVVMATVDSAVPHFSDRVAEAQQLVASKDRTPGLNARDRELLGDTLRDQLAAISRWSAREQLLHGEPHAGNVLNTQDGPLFVDLETCCRGPVEFDLAHVPEEVSECYAGADHELLGACRLLVLAMVAAWRWDRDDQLPNGRRAGRELLAVLYAGPPWPSLDLVWSRTP